MDSICRQDERWLDSQPHEASVLGDQVPGKQIWNMISGPAIYSMNGPFE